MPRIVRCVRRAGRRGCLAARCRLARRTPAPQQQRVGDHRHRARRHRRAGDHRREPARAPPAECRAHCRRRRRTGSAGSWPASRGRDRSPRRPRRGRCESSVTSAADSALPVPAPIANDTSACASAGASLTPSPTMPTTQPALLQRRDRRALVLRQLAGAPVVDAGGARDRLGRRRVVAGQHRQRDAPLAQQPHRIRGAGSKLVGERDPADQRVAARRRRRSSCAAWPPRVDRADVDVHARLAQERRASRGAASARRARR